MALASSENSGWALLGSCIPVDETQRDIRRAGAQDPRMLVVGQCRELDNWKEDEWKKIPVIYERVTVGHETLPRTARRLF